jgi:VanZ family protein
MTVRSDDPTVDKSLTNRLRAWGPAAGWAAVLFLLSASSDLGGVVGFPFFVRVPFGDKVAHAVLYAVLGTALAWGRARSLKPAGHVLLLTLGALYGVSDEWHQMYVPGRIPDVADWFADLFGLFAGYGAAINVFGWNNEKMKTEELM